MDGFGKLSARLMVLDETVFNSFSFGMLHLDQREVESWLECDALALENTFPQYHLIN